MDAAEIKPFRIQYYCEKRDPDFEAKMHEVLLVYKQIEMQFDENGKLIVPDDYKLTITVQDTIRIIRDNHSAHTSKETRRFLDTMPKGRFKFVFTPKHGSWLNMIESFFSKMTRQMLRGIRVNTKEELEERIYKYFDEVNREPVIYRWKYKMDEISEEEAASV